MITIPIWLLVLLSVLGFVGLIHLIGYGALLVATIIGYHRNKKIEKQEERKCPYFVENNDGE